jgi:Ca-activated chloride channel homolog
MKTIAVILGLLVFLINYSFASNQAQVDLQEGKELFLKCLKCHDGSKASRLSPTHKTKKQWHRYSKNNFNRLKRKMPDLESYAFSNKDLNLIFQYLMANGLDSDNPQTCDGEESISSLPHYKKTKAFIKKKAIPSNFREKRALFKKKASTSNYKRPLDISRARQNSSKYNTEEYEKFNENPFLAAKTNPVSTFSIDVDTASYSNTRRFLNDNQLPPKDAVRLEEFINYFTYEYPQPAKDNPVAIYSEMSSCPWNPEHDLLSLSLQGKTIPKKDLPPANLVFLIDVSGSMKNFSKLPLLKSALELLVKQMRKEDRIAIAVYAGAAGLTLPSTSGNQKEIILNSLNKLEAGGSTAGGAGIQLAYDTGQKNFLPNGNNRIILATDGDFNVGLSSNGALERLIEEKKKSGIFLTVLGFGRGNYKDSKMEKLADKGDGNYAYIDSLREAEKVLVQEMGGTLFTIAKDVKIQVEFNPAKIKSYRQIGYENRQLRKEEFNNDKIDAGEMGSGQSVTVFYELIKAGDKENITPVVELKYQDNIIKRSALESQEIMTVKLRYTKPGETESKLTIVPIPENKIKFAMTSDNFRFATAVTEFGLLLKDSKFKGNASFSKLIERAKSALGKDKEIFRFEFVNLADKARLLNGP